MYIEVLTDEKIKAEPYFWSVFIAQMSFSETHIGKKFKMLAKTMSTSGWNVTVHLLNITILDITG